MARCGLASCTSFRYRHPRVPLCAVPPIREPNRNEFQTQKWVQTFVTRYGQPDHNVHTLFSVASVAARRCQSLRAETMLETDNRVYTIGHSNRSLEDFLALLKEFDIQALADIRSQPGSLKFPHFNLENLETVLPAHGVRYIWLPKLGGRRRARKGFDSPNTGLSSQGFRSYADYMCEEDFRQGVGKLLSVASESRTAYMCAEALYWRCHRLILSDYLVAQGIEVLHILGPKNLRSHKITEGALVTQQGNVVYPAIP